MQLAKYATEDFIRDGFGNTPSGSAELLVSQSLVPPYTDGADLSSSFYSWPYITGSSMVWNAPSTGSVEPGYIVGVKAMLIDNTGEDNRKSFQLCNSLSLVIDVGGVSQVLLLDILERQFISDHVYFKVASYPLSAISGAIFTFKKDANDNFLGYECNASADGSSSITFVVEPYYSALENSVFDPLANNVIEGVKSSIAKVVDPNSEYASSASIVIQPAEIPDYFYTSLASISSRFLGSKTGYQLKSRKVGISGSDIIKEFISNYHGNYVDTGSAVSGAISGSSTGSYNASVRKLSNDTVDLLGRHISSISPTIISSSSQSALQRELQYSEIGVDPAFFAVQEFQGSVYSVDADNVPDIKDMEFTTMKFSTGTILEKASISGSGGETLLYTRTYNKNNNNVEESGSEDHAASLPTVGDVIYAEGLEKRLVNSKVYVQETSYVLLTDEFGSVKTVQTGSAV